MRTAAVIVAAGRGTRAGGDIPKQFQMLNGMPVMCRSVRAFHLHGAISDVVVVVAAADLDRAAALLADSGLAATVVAGGETRKGSVMAGLAALPDGVSHVLIHDGARPLVSPACIDRVLAALETAPCAAPALAVTDALWRGAEGRVTGNQPRDGLWRAQTPQGFALPAIRAAHAADTGEDAADDVEVARRAGLDVVIVEGEEDNLKITHPADFDRAARLLETRVDIRSGNGFDVHRFGPGDHVMLCGVRIPHGRGLQGHSDADVGMHAVTDALYGALAEGDIGRHFPPSDPQWKGAASEIFLAHAVALVAERGYRIANIDCTLICEHPKIGPHAPEMTTEMARIMKLPEDRISIKATTSERLGFTGREEGIAALATVMLVAS